MAGWEHESRNTKSTADKEIKRRTWAENNQIKLACRKDRRHFAHRDSRPERPSKVRKLPLHELKKVAKCAKCGQLGTGRQSAATSTSPKRLSEKGPARRFSFNRLEKKLAERNLKVVRLDDKPAAACGVGGRVNTLFVALVPCAVAGQPGVIRMIVVADDIP